MKGWIALDIDGTITDDLHDVSSEVAVYFKSLVAEGWQFVFITGRIFSLAHSALKRFDFPYFLAVQNGADILEMPAKRLVHRSYFTSDVIGQIQEAYLGEKEDFLIYAGYERGDFCFFRPARFSPTLLSYLNQLRKLSPEPWQAVENFNFDPHMSFPLIKCLGNRHTMEKIHLSLNKNSALHVTMIRDPFCEELYLNLITDARASKGEALNLLTKNHKRIIAGGDDFNDLSMLRLASTRIVMATAPKELLELADIVAPPASQLGIIPALKKAVAL